MTRPFDEAIVAVARAGYHNHRLETHSDVVSNALFKDLLERCAPLRSDLDAGIVKVWINVRSPGDRLRKIDLFVGEPGPAGELHIPGVRIALENKSVITAHRNRTNRFDDLTKVLSTIHSARPEALLVATVLIGLAQRVLNIPDQVHPFFRDREDEFVAKVLPRLSSGDETLWTEFSWAISRNTAADPGRTIVLLRTLPTRKPGHTHIAGYDFVLLVPVRIDNVNPPSLPRPNTCGIDVDADYERMLEQLCAAYTARWHM
ncbi:MAG: hypothetical protein M3373_14730 [Gemmatimonadota bacterium]|nr:hypothetical protein [Gemmatimonadota bacterium]